MTSARRIMIVEDSPTVRYQVKLMLEKLNIILVEAANEVGMFNLMEEYGVRVDLIIMDLTLKNENGLDLIKKLRDSENYMDIPVLILTEHADMNSVLKARELGVSGYLRKPIQKDELVDRIQGILQPE